MNKVGYLHIPNLYKDLDILAFKEVYALEKIHGTSAHISFKLNGNLPTDFGGPATTPVLTYFSGGEKQENFVKLFNENNLLAKFIGLGLDSVTIYGEAYGGKQQGMKDTYGPELKFVCFDVLIGENWLSVPQAADFCSSLGLEFVHYVKIPATLEALNNERDAPSVQAARNGCGNDKIREGIVIRPPFEVKTNNGKRLIAKHKRDEFKETSRPRKVDPAQLEVLTNAIAIASEWVTEMRLSHVLDKLSPPATKMEDVKRVIVAMQEDVKREAEGEIVWSNEVATAIARATPPMFKKRISKI